MNQVDVYMPLMAHGHKVGEYLVIVRPCDDAALGGILNSSEVYFEGFDGKRHAMNQYDARDMLQAIQSDMPSVWKEIEEAAEADFLEGCDPEDDRDYHNDAGFARAM